MAVDSSGWTAASPAGTDQISAGDDLFRSDKSLLEALINDEHYFAPLDSASSLSGGVHRVGSARIYLGSGAALSQVSAAADDMDGRMIFDDKTGALAFLRDSSVSTVLGGTRPTGVILQISGTSIAPDGAGSALTLGSALYEVPAGAYHSSGETQWTIPSGLSGLWRIDVQVVTDDDGSGEHVAMVMNEDLTTTYVRGSALSQAEATAGWASAARRINFSTVIEVSSGDSFTIVAGSDGADPNVLNSGQVAAGDKGTRVAMFRLGGGV